MEPAGWSPLREEEEEEEIDEVPLAAAVARRPHDDNDDDDDDDDNDDYKPVNGVPQQDNGATTVAKANLKSPPSDGDDKEPVPDKKREKNPFELDPSWLRLSPQELEWATDVRESIDSLVDVDIHFSDFMCAHLAIAAKGDLDWAINRVYKMQDVMKEYKILGTYQEAIVAIREVFDLLGAGILPHFSCDPASGECLVIFDGTVALKEVWSKNPKNIDTTIRGIFYLSYAEHPTLECVRVGNVHMFDMDGFQWGRGMSDVKEFAKITNETVCTFPNVLQHTKFYNTPSIANIVVSMVKKMIPKDVASAFTFGHQFAGGQSLKNFYLVPTPEAAQERAYQSVCQSMKLRFDSEEAFSLPDPDTDSAQNSSFFPV